MRNFFLITLLIATLASCLNSNNEDSKSAILCSISTQLKTMVESMPADKVFRSYDEKSGCHAVSYHNWTSGFPAGTFWYMYELTGDEYWKAVAHENTVKLDGVQYITTTHDLGFMVYCSYGNAYRLTGGQEYKDVIMQASESLISRYNPKIGCIKSWDWAKHWQFPVIIDNMMNLEMLFFASKETGDPKYRDIAISHANTTLDNHFRDNMSSYHVVDYDTITGKAIAKVTHQGYNNESSWGRGQAWALYGFTVCYRETKTTAYLEAAEKIAGYIINNLPEDYVSYWDYNAPGIPDINRDASAAAITASALFELGRYSEKGKSYIDIAQKITNSLTTEKYRAAQGTNGGFLLMHSVGSLPEESEVDVALNYADYYYVEALKRKFQILK